MLEFRVKNVVPPGGQYFYEVEGMVLQDPTKTGLRTRINQAYAAMGKIVPADIGARVQDFMCRRLPEGFCTGSDDGLPRAKVLTIHDIRKNTDKMVRATEPAPPSKTKFQARACNQCPKNNRSMCPTCSGINAWASRRVGRPNTPAEFSWLGVCEVDGTALAAKVNRQGLPANEEYPAECWITEGADAG
jgi:hypothetical protein